MSKLRATVLSAGAWSQSSHLPALAADADVEIAAVTSPDAEAAAAIARRFDVPAHFTDWQAALDPAPDIAVVSSPPVAHEKQVIAALKAGAHVLVEKPFALDEASARRMRDAAGAAGRHLLVGFGWPASPVFARARTLVEAGEIGLVEHMIFHLAVNTRALLSGGSDGGWGGNVASGAATYTDPRVSAGGSVAVSMSHQLGLVDWLTGDRITAVQASTFPPGADIDLHASVNAEFAGGGSAAISSASTHPYLARPQWHMALYGARGQVWLDSMADHLRLVRADGTQHEYAESGEYDPGAPTKALIACARGAPAPSGLDARLAARVAAVTDAIYAAARSGEKHRIDDQ